MNNNISRKSFLRQGSALFGGALIAPYTSLTPLISQAQREPIRMMYNENPYGPSRIAKKAIAKSVQRIESVYNANCSK